MTTQEMAREAAEFVQRRAEAQKQKQIYRQEQIARLGGVGNAQPPIAEPPKPPETSKPAADSPPPPVLRGRAGEGVPANGAFTPNPLPNPPPEYRGREKAEQNAIQNDTKPRWPGDDEWGSTDLNEYDVAGKLSPRQLIAVDLLVSGKNDREVAEAVCVQRVTVTRWRLYHLAFRAAVSRRRKQTFGVASDRLRNLLAKAIDVLEKQLASDDPKQQMAAIRLMISLSKQCNLQPPDEPESSREILELEAKQCRLQRFEKDERRLPPDSEDFEEAAVALNARSSACLYQEQQPKPSALQNDTDREREDAAECPGTRASSPAQQDDAEEAGEDAGVPGSATQIDTNLKLDVSAPQPLTGPAPDTTFPDHPSSKAVAI